MTLSSDSYNLAVTFQQDFYHTCDWIYEFYFKNVDISSFDIQLDNFTYCFTLMHKQLNFATKILNTII